MGIRCDFMNPLTKNPPPLPETSSSMIALSSPKPKRLRRLALRFVLVVAAVSVLGSAYWFTRPPEMIWWRSPEIGKTGLYVHLLIPSGWERDPKFGYVT